MTSRSQRLMWQGSVEKYVTVVYITGRTDIIEILPFKYAAYTASKIWTVGNNRVRAGSLSFLIVLCTTRNFAHPYAVLPFTWFFGFQNQKFEKRRRHIFVLFSDTDRESFLKLFGHMQIASTSRWCGFIVQSLLRKFWFHGIFRERRMFKSLQ